SALLQPLRRLGQGAAQDLLDLGELLAPCDQRRRELDHRVAAVVGAADQPAAVELPGQEAAQQPLRLVGCEPLLGALVLYELDRLEVARAADVADDRDVAKALEGRA